MSDLLGTQTPTDRVAQGDMFRGTWTFYGSSVLPAFLYDAPGASQFIYSWLPTKGLNPASFPSALPDDETVSFHFRVLPNAGLSTVADLVARLSDPPAAMYFTALRRIQPGLTSAQLANDLTAARTDAEKKANSNPVIKAVADVASGTFDFLKLALLAVAIGGAVYLYSRFKK
jgi:hypothetical protein